MLVTQKELAEILDVSFVSLNRWKTGKFISTIKAKKKLNEYFIKYQIDDINRGEKI